MKIVLWLKHSKDHTFLTLSDLLTHLPYYHKCILQNTAKRPKSINTKEIVWISLSDGNAPKQLQRFICLLKNSAKNKTSICWKSRNNVKTERKTRVNNNK